MAAAILLFEDLCGRHTLAVGGAEDELHRAGYGHRPFETVRISACTNDVCSAGVCTHPQNGSCGSAPCSALCANPTVFTTANFQSGNLGTGAACYQTTAALSGGNCGNFVSPRTLSVNGSVMSCNNGNWSSLPPKVNGGYCVQTTTGNQAWAYFTTW